MRHTEGEKLAQEIRKSSASKGPRIEEGEALQHIMKDSATYEKFKAADSKEQGQMLVAAKNEIVEGKAGGKAPEVKKIPEGKRGSVPGKRAGTTRETPEVRKAKAAERIAKVREKAKRTKISEAEEAQARAQATGIDVSKIQIPEMEEYLRTKKPTSWRHLQEQRKAKAIPDHEYIEALRFYVTEGLEGPEE
jgi:hypothetical protein